MTPDETIPKLYFPEYEKREARGDAFPGYVAGRQVARHLHPKEKGTIPEGAFMQMVLRTICPLQIHLIQLTMNFLVK